MNKKNYIVPLHLYILILIYGLSINCSFSGFYHFTNTSLQSTPLIEGGDPPNDPILIFPLNSSTGNATTLTLSVQVSDPDLDPLNVAFFGRKKLSPDDDFTIIGLPDTQYYTGELWDGSPDIFYSQTQWIVDNISSRNITFVSHYGDCVENGDAAEDEWKVADTAMLSIENPETTALIDGMPYAISVGNHDQSPFGDPEGTTTLYNAYFGEDRFNGRQYYGGHYGLNNDNSFQLFDAGGMEFIAIHLEYDPGANSNILSWLDNLLDTYSSRRAIIVTHFLIAPGNPGSFHSQGQAIYNQVKNHSNVFLMLAGHYPGEGQRTDLYNGNSIHTLLSNYQMRPFGGNGWLRIMQFSPANNSIDVKTYSPWLDEWEADTDSEFSLVYDMQTAGYKNLDNQLGVPSGSNLVLDWPALDPETEYEWYAVLDDGINEVKGPTWSFTTGKHQLDIKVFLEGAFSEGSMSTDLENNIPLTQPYAALPWAYEGDESVLQLPPDVVDWVLIELRETTDPAIAFSDTRIHRMAGFLKTNGTVVGLNGNSLLEFPNVLTMNLYAVVWHRNHLAVISASSLTNSAGIFSYDFTSGEGKALGGQLGHIQLSGGFWGMVAGNSNNDGVIDDNDKSSWELSSGKTGYLDSDNNFDAEADNSDKNKLWLKNLGKSSVVPD